MQLTIGSFKESATVSDKNYGKNCYLESFLFLPSPPRFPYHSCEAMIKTWVKLCYGFTILYRRRGVFLNRLFKIPITKA